MYTPESWGQFMQYVDDFEGNVKAKWDKFEYATLGFIAGALVLSFNLWQKGVPVSYYLVGA